MLNITRCFELGQCKETTRAAPVEQARKEARKRSRIHFIPVRHAGLRSDVVFLVHMLRPMSKTSGLGLHRYSVHARLLTTVLAAVMTPGHCHVRKGATGGQSGSGDGSCQVSWAVWRIKVFGTTGLPCLRLGRPLLCTNTVVEANKHIHVSASICMYSIRMCKQQSQPAHSGVELKRLAHSPLWRHHRWDFLLRLDVAGCK